MISRTKFKIDNAGIEKLFAAAGINGITNIHPLGDGEFNAVFAAEANGIGYVVKIAPGKDVSVLYFEENMLESEVFWYEQMAKHTTIRTPKVYFKDYSKEIIPTSYFIMEKLDGIQLDKMKLDEAGQKNSAAKTAMMAAQIHKIKNDKFGYVQQELHDNWHLGFSAIIQSIVDYCHSKGKKTKRGTKLLEYIEKHKAILEKAECSMVNFDIWPPNILFMEENGEQKYAWIDPERSYWGDRIVEFVCLEFLLPFAEKKTSLEAYNSVSDDPIVIGREEEIRYAFGQAHLGLIMEVEKYSRYSPRHFGWWRNVLVSKMLFKSAFETLENA